MSSPYATLVFGLVTCTFGPPTTPGQLWSATSTMHSNNAGNSILSMTERPATVDSAEQHRTKGISSGKNSHVNINHPISLLQLGVADTEYTELQQLVTPSTTKPSVCFEMQHTAPKPALNRS